MAMNWTGGTRNCAIKTATTSRLQKRYFAKVRAAAQTVAVPSSQGNLPHVFKRKSRMTPEFDIVVKKARTDHGGTTRRGSSPPLHIDRDSGKRGGKEMEENIRRARRRILLEREDWVCTALSKPLVLKSREEMRKLKTNSHRDATETSSSGSTSSEEEEGDDDDDDDSSTLQNDGRQGAISIGHENRRRMIQRDDTPELPEYPEHSEDIYIHIGGSTQRSSTTATNPTRSAESASRSTEIDSTTIRGSSVDTMLLDCYRHEPMFQFRHITPAVSDIVEQKRREVQQKGYSSSPLTRYSRRRGNRVPRPLDGELGEVSEGDRLIEEVERASSPIPSNSVHSTIVVRHSPGAHGKECFCSRAKRATEYDFSRIAGIESPIDKKFRGEEALGRAQMISATPGPSQVSWSTSPAERQPYQHQGEQSFDEIASGIVSSENFLNLDPSVGSANGTQSQVGVMPGTEKMIHETAGEGEEGRREESLRMENLDDSGIEGVVDSEVEESEMEMGQDDHSLGHDRESADPGSLDSGEDSVKDTPENTDSEWDEESATATDEDTGDILDTIYVASTIAHEETSAEAVGLTTDDPRLHAQLSCIAAYDRPGRTENGQAKHNIAECNNIRDSLDSTVEDQGKFPQILAASSDLFKSSPFDVVEHGEYENQGINTDSLPSPPSLETSKAPEPTPTKKPEKSKRPSQRFLIPPYEHNGDNLQGAAPFRARGKEHKSHTQQQHQHKKLPHPPPEDVTSPITSPVALVYSRPYCLGVGPREPPTTTGGGPGPGAGGRRRKVGGEGERSGRELVREGDGEEVEDIEDF
ncbi:unnamed protein product [Tuber aestivum]|uniref:Uncharacterized protein n=1 Tax=Tuber aestivum TaxID=59557 RepID=A0A292PL23_9PEZI|nr:unnamed protein product [Tuber aestivum]